MSSSRLMVVLPQESCSYTGLMRWNSNTNQKEVMSSPGGETWTPIYGSIGGGGIVDVSPETERILQWAEKKMLEEDTMSVLCAQYPGIKDLQDKLEMMIALVKQENDVKQ